MTSVGAASGKEWDFGGGGIAIRSDVNYSTTLQLAMFKNVDSTGIVSWVDMGRESDQWGSTFTVELDRASAEAYEKGLKGEFASEVTLTGLAGFYPFSPLFDYTGGVSVALDAVPVPDEVNLYGDAVQYEIGAVPSDNINLVLPEADAQPSCGSIPEDWEIDAGVWLPYPDDGFRAVLNVRNGATRVNGGSVSTLEPFRDVGEVSKVTVRLDEEKARQLLALFTGNRGGGMSSSFPVEFSPFAHLYEAQTNFITRLASEEVTLKYYNPRNIDVSFQIQIIEVVP